MSAGTSADAPGLAGLATFLAESFPDRLPRQVIARTRHHMLDAITAWVAGRGTAEAKLLKAHAESWQAGPTSGKLLLDVQLHCALARMSEIDDIHQAAGITPGGIVVPAALTIAASRGDVDADELVEAVVAGYEAMSRLALALGGPACLYRGIWPTYLAAPFGVAAVAARLLRLDATLTAQALALSLARAAPNVGHHNAGTTSRWLAIGMAAREGVAAALAARAGFTSDLGILEGRFFSDVYQITPEPQRLLAGLGESFAVAQTSIKPWCAARQTMAATQALKELLAAGLVPGAITRIDIAVPPPYLGMVNHGVQPGDRASFLTSLPYRLAVAALDPDAEYDIAQNPPAIGRDTHDLMAKIAVKADAELLAHYPKAWPGAVRIDAGGEVYERQCVFVAGDAGLPFDAALVARKFERWAPAALRPHALPLLGDDEISATELYDRIFECLYVD